MLDPFHLRKSAAHKTLLGLAKTHGQESIQSFFGSDSQRHERMHGNVHGLHLDWSKHRVSNEVMDALFALAEEAGWRDGQRKLFGGDPINQTESRAVLHMALRGYSDDPFHVDGEPVMPRVLATRKTMLEFADAVHSDASIRDVVNIGIGGSDLGPLMVTKALRNQANSGTKVHFVSNVDGAHLEAVLNGLDPATTLFIVVSKTFTTQETMANAEAARSWIAERLGDSAIPNHFAAVSTNIPAAAGFGIDHTRIFGFDDWVGGRYSLWGPVGLSIACSIGGHSFQELLDGARAMDRHFVEASNQENLPLISALLGVWYREYLGFSSHVVLPYAQDLDRFPAYLQQADMESNGKCVGRDGKEVAHSTGPVVWGEAGTNGQHAFYQLLHQGTDVHPVDIIAVRQPLSQYKEHHRKLLANAIAQAEALMRGRSFTEVQNEMRASGKSEEEINRIGPHRVFEGNRPSSFILLDQLNPFNLGLLIALYEHRIFVQGLLWNICSFDQWGVELGKVLANRILSDWESRNQQQNHDSSTLDLMRRLK